MNLIKNDIVKIKDLLGVNLPPKMIAFSGRIVTISKVYNDDFYILEDEGRYKWNISMVSKIIYKSRFDEVKHKYEYYNAEFGESFYKYADNMNLNYLNNKYDECVNRDNEINRLCEIIARKNKCNPVLIGKAGVGKTAIVEGLVAKIIEMNMSESIQYINHPLYNKVIYNLNLNSLISGTKYRGDFEDRLTTIINIAINNPNVILFIDEIHMITGLNNSVETGTVSMAQMIKQPLSRGDISVIGATTTDEYDKIKSDKALNRRFSPVVINEFSKDSMKLLLQSIKNTYSQFHSVEIGDNIMKATLSYCDDFYEDKVFPDKLIDIIDETAARVKLNNYDKDNVVMTIDDIKKTVFNQTGKILV